MRVGDIIQRGTNASRPAATAVPPGTLYYDTTNSTLDRSNGTSWETVEGSGGSYTDEQAQDAVGTILTDSSTVDFTYTDATPAITAAVLPSGIKLDDLGTPDDNTDLNASTTRHGLLRKLSGTSTEYLDGSGAWSTPAGGGGGSLTQAYAGHNSIGATAEGVTLHRAFLKKVTLANDCLIASVDIYCKQNTAANAYGIVGFVYDDSGGEPLHMLSRGGVPNAQPTLNLYRTSGVAGDARWLSTPQGIWVTAGDYWIGGMVTGQAVVNFYYDGTGGTDCYWDAGGNAFVTDAPDTSGTVYTRTDTTRRYSFRANTIR